MGRIIIVGTIKALLSKFKKLLWSSKISSSETFIWTKSAQINLLSAHNLAPPPKKKLFAIKLAISKIMYKVSQRKVSF